MPRVKRRTKRRLDYTDSEIQQLSGGVSMTNPRFGTWHRNNVNWPVFEQAWDDLCDEILPGWIAAHPFTRPAGWILFEVKEPRLPVVGEASIEALEWNREHRDFRQCFFLGINRRLGIDDDSRDSEAAYECEKQYLTRLGLLTDAEKQLL
jgi:hypothetical protein